MKLYKNIVLKSKRVIILLEILIRRDKILYCYDIAIIGAGPTGLFAVFQAGMLGLKVCIIDALDHPGGQCAALYPEKPIYDIPGYPKILAQDLVDKLLEQIKPFSPELLLKQKASAFSYNEGDPELKTNQGAIIKAKAIIIAAGGGAFKHTRPPLAGLEAFEGKSVFYKVTNREIFREKSVTIAGGGDSALDWSISLAKIAREVYLIHRRHKFKGAPSSVAQMQALAEVGKIKLVIPYHLHSLHGREGQLEEISVSDLDLNVKTIKSDFLLAFFGLSIELGPLADWQLHMYHKHIVVNPATMETNLPKVFAIGDIVDYPGKLKLILTGFAEAAVAAHSAYKCINPDKELHFEHSTTKGIADFA